MKKVRKIFFNMKSEQEWLSQQKGWKLVSTVGMSYTFEESTKEYNYEYIYFDNCKIDLDKLLNQITDKDIEFVCYSSSRALFRKDAAKGQIHVYSDNYDKYKMLMKKHTTYSGLGACYICLGSSQTALSTTLNDWFWISSALFYICSALFFVSSYYFKKYAENYDDGTFASRMRNDK